MAVKRKFPDVIDLLNACKAAAKRDTAYKPLEHLWSSENPLAEHCGAIAHVVQHYYGGEIMSGKDNKGVRWLWNRLPDGKPWHGQELSLDYVGSNMPPVALMMPPRKTVNPRFALFLERVKAELVKAKYRYVCGHHGHK